WIDALSLALCHYLVRAAQTTGQPLRLIAAARPSSNGESLAVSTRQLLPAEHMREIDLGPLANTEALELAKELAPDLGDDEARSLADQAGGAAVWHHAPVTNGRAARVD